MSTISIGSVATALEEAGLLVERRGTVPDEASGITDDSRLVVPGGLFVAVRGTAFDGHDYLDAAGRAGAAAAIVEDDSRTALPALVVNDGRRAAGIAAAAAYGHPSRELRMIAVTGTNVKTTTVGLLRHLFAAPDARAASIGTLGVLVGGEGTQLPGGGGLTTPGPVELQRLLRALRDDGIRTVAMEVSSHSLHQRRVEGVHFAAGVFTNLTRDHLDYHGTMDEYLGAKSLLVELLSPDGVAVVNADDEAWKALPPAPRRVTFGIGTANADVRATDIDFAPRGSRWALSVMGAAEQVQLPLIGDFNVANALAAAATAFALGMPLAAIARKLREVPQVPGRLELLHDEPAVLRDYAHTPDALERALDAVRPFTRGRLIVVFGCGGDRDPGKRPIMGRIAEEGADVVVLTSDNPRTEDPEQILDDIESGMHGRDHLRIEDRRDAIARAIALARAEDVVLLAGKGHETYQVRGTVKHPFDEREIVRDLTAGAAR